MPVFGLSTLSLLLFPLLLPLWMTAPSTTTAAAAAAAAMPQPIVVNTWPFTAATKAAYTLLTQSPTTDPIDAVVEGCSVAEELQCDHTVGWGGSPDSNGESTLDAMVMSGTTMKSGAVANLRNIRQAAQVARDVYSKTKHSMLAGSLATEFAVKMGYAAEDISSEWSRGEHQRWLDNQCLPNFWTLQTDGKCENADAAHSSSDVQTPNLSINSGNHDTIGMLALQANGRMAVGVSSNGAKHKIAGRVGDSPIVGSGGFVDDAIGAATATGDGDIMLRFGPSIIAVELLRSGHTPLEAATEALRRIAVKFPDFSGAVVVLNNTGHHAAAAHGFNDFSYSVASDDGDVQVIEVQPTTFTINTAIR